MTVSLTGWETRLYFGSVRIGVIFLSFLLWNTTESLGQSEGEALSTVPGVVTGSYVSVRSRPDATANRLVTLRAGQRVRVQGRVFASRAAGDSEEPVEWLRIDLPREVDTAWVSEEFIDPVTRRSLTPILNVRAGPAIFYGVLIQIEQGTEVEIVGRRDEWLAIRPPQGSYAFVLSKDIRIEAAGIARRPTSPQRNYGPGRRLSQSEATAEALAGSRATSLGARSQAPSAVPGEMWPGFSDGADSAEGGRRAWLTPMRVARNPSSTGSVRGGGLPTAGRVPGLRGDADRLPGIDDLFSAPGTVGTISEEMFVPVEAADADRAGPSTPPGHLVASGEIALDSPQESLLGNGDAQRETLLGPGPRDTREVLKRNVTREGIVRKVSNPLAPSNYELVSVSRGRRMEFLENAQFNGDFKSFVGKRVLVFGSELKDRYWSAPVLAVDRLTLYPSANGGTN